MSSSFINISPCPWCNKRLPCRCCARLGSGTTNDDDEEEEEEEEEDDDDDDDDDDANVTVVAHLRERCQSSPRGVGC